MILDGIKDHVIPHVIGNYHAYEMWEALTKLYQSSIENGKMVLKEKLKAIKMKGSKGVVAYLTCIIDVRDELASIGEIVADTKFVSATLHRFPKSWEAFVEGIVAHENLPGGKP